jgi:phosphate transport system protein
MGEVTSTLEAIWRMLFDQGERVTTLVLDAVEAFFEHDINAAKAVTLADATIDHVDVEIERCCIKVLGEGVQGEYTLRSILTIVKVNNELERIADCAVDIAKAATETSNLPPTVRVMANSVVGMLRDANTALATRDTVLGRRVLSFDDTVEAFKTEVLGAAQTSLAKGTIEISAAIGLLSMVRAVERIADHCTNICEQTIYLETGNIVRHLPSGWTDPAPPDDTQDDS